MLTTVELPVPTLTPVLVVLERVTVVPDEVLGKVLVSLTETVEEPARTLEAGGEPVNVSVNVPLEVVPVL
jgi:hypothetical protein